MNGRGQYGRRYVSSLSPSPWATPWPPSPWGTPPPPPWARRPPIFVGASEQALANAAVAPSVTGPVPAPVAVPGPAVVVQDKGKGITFGSILKFGAIGALVIGGAVAASSLFTTVKKGREPVRYYADLYREQTAHSRRR